MNISELERIMSEADINICPVCGTPYEKYHSRQQTCGTDECKRLWKNKYLRERRERLIAEDKDAFNRMHAEAQKRSRHKKKRLENLDDTLKQAQEYWERFEKRHATDKPDGKSYAEKQVADTLAKVPKIDVSGFGKEKR
jgi:rubrerythrin